MFHNLRLNEAAAQQWTIASRFDRSFLIRRVFYNCQRIFRTLLLGLTYRFSVGVPWS
jgi:hypothetical protein